MTRSISVIFIISMILFSAGCGKEPTQVVDDEGRVIVDNRTEAERKVGDIHQRMLDDMQSFDESVDAWMADSQIQPQNQGIDLDGVATHLPPRLAKFIQNGKLLDPAGNPYVILPLDPNSNIHITVSKETASMPDFKDVTWGDYAPR